MIKVAPSILSADFANLGEGVKNAEEWGADYIHFDVMDGTYVPKLSFGYDVCKAIRKYTKLPIDVHLMTEHPETFLKPFKDAGADIVTFHIEADRHANRTLNEIKKLGMLSGVALNPSTPVSAVENIIELCDIILLMSVNPGLGGQEFIPQSIRKIVELRSLADTYNPKLEIEMDGGINTHTAELCVRAGANVLVAGSSVYKAEKPSDVIARMHEL